jgi:ribosomal protein L11 methyltransferase
MEDSGQGAGRLKLVLEEPDRDSARRLAGALQDLIEPAPAALTLFENGAGGWRIETYYDEPQPAADWLAGEVAALTGLPAPDFVAEAVPDLNWVALSQAALPPVAAGRFTVHGSHDRGRVPQGPNAILIDAGEAFGTAHHATTFGCLAAIDRLARRRRVATNVLDLGCGSGVLAIAAARAMPRARIIASDLDHQSVVVARANFAANGEAARIRAVVADGLGDPALRRRAPFDLLVANILAGPLIALAKDIRRVVVPTGTVVLSGLLTGQAPQVIAAYRAAGFALVAHTRLAGWSTLVLARWNG